MPFFRIYYYLFKYFIVSLIKYHVKPRSINRVWQKTAHRYCLSLALLLLVRVTPYTYNPTSSLGSFCLRVFFIDEYLLWRYTTCVGDNKQSQSVVVRIWQQDGAPTHHGLNVLKLIVGEILKQTFLSSVNKQ